MVFKTRRTEICKLFLEIYNSCNFTILKKFNDKDCKPCFFEPFLLNTHLTSFAIIYAPALKIFAMSWFWSLFSLIFITAYIFNSQIFLTTVLFKRRKNKTKKQFSHQLLKCSTIYFSLFAFSASVLKKQITSGCLVGTHQNRCTPGEVNSIFYSGSERLPQHCKHDRLKD